MPVVRVKDVGREAEELAAADDGAAEEGEALEEVVEAVEPRRVDLLAIEEVSRSSTRISGTSLPGSVARRNVASAAQFAQVIARRRRDDLGHDAVALEPLPRLPIVRHEDDDVVAELRAALSAASRRRRRGRRSWRWARPRRWRRGFSWTQFIAGATDAVLSTCTAITWPRDTPLILASRRDQRSTRSPRRASSRHSCRRTSRA